MVSLEKFYENVNIRYHPDEIKKKFEPLLHDVLLRLPDEPQFLLIDEIYFASKLKIIENLHSYFPKQKISLNQNGVDNDGNCQTGINKKGEISDCVISIIVDYLKEKSDDYIMGVIIHEICHMIWFWNILQKEKPYLKKLGIKAAKIRLDQIGIKDLKPKSPEYYERERKVNDVARSLGFEKEINCI